MFNLIEQIVGWALALVSKFGYGGIFFTMMLESAAVPIPSEVVVPFGGFLAAGGRLNLTSVVLVSTMANLAGSILIYWIGFWGGRPLLDRYGKYFLIHGDDVTKLERWSKRYGSRIAFFSRLMPGVRTFSSVVIGTGRVEFRKFVFYTFTGSLLWNLPLAYAGYAAGNNWDFLRPYFHKFELGIAVLLIIAALWFVSKHTKKLRAGS